MNTDRLIMENSLLRSELDKCRDSIDVDKNKILVEQNDYLMIELVRRDDEINALRDLLWEYQTGNKRPRIK